MTLPDHVSEGGKRWLPNENQVTFPKKGRWVVGKENLQTSLPPAGPPRLGIECLGPWDLGFGGDFAPSLGTPVFHLFSEFLMPLPALPTYLPFVFLLSLSHLGS